MKKKPITVEERMALILKDRENFLNGDNKTYSFEEVKQMALDKNKRKLMNLFGSIKWGEDPVKFQRRLRNYNNTNLKL